MTSKKALIHDISYFSQFNIRTTSNLYGINKESLEVNLWIYEILGQIQSIDNKNTILKGGGASQLYLPVDVQRCTNDIDLICNIEKVDIEELLEYIRENMIKSGFPCSFKQYIPTFTKNKLPMSTYLLYLPFKYARKKLYGLKLDFLYGDIDLLEKQNVEKPSILGLDLAFDPLCVSRNTLIGEKLLTFATHSIGLEEYKIESFYKNIYDLYYLINTDTSIETFKNICEKTIEAVNFEQKLKNLSALSTSYVLNNILSTLFKIFIDDLKIKKGKVIKHIKKFSDTVLQRDIRQSLSMDSWAVMTMNIYIYVHTINEYIEMGNIESLNIINKYKEVEEYVESLSNTQRKKYRKDLLNKILEWDYELDIEDTSIFRLLFLDILLEANMI